MPLVYYLMGPLRPVVDHKVFGFALGHAFTPGDFTINNAGGCRLNPQMAKKVVGHIANLPPVHQIGAFLRWITAKETQPCTQAIMQPLSHQQPFGIRQEIPDGVGRGILQFGHYPIIWTNTPLPAQNPNGLRHRTEPQS